MAQSITGARNYVEVPAPDRKIGGALDVVRVVDATDAHSLLGAEYQTDACFSADLWLGNCGNFPTVDCATGVTPAAEVKDFHGLSTVVGDPFTLYTGVECPSPGIPLDSYRARAEGALSLKESRGVEERLTTLLAAWPNAPALGPDRIAEAVASLEGWLEQNYAGRGLILMSRYVATLAGAAQVVAPSLDGRLATVVGTPVVLGVGDNTTLFASGQITLLRGQVIVNAVSEMNAGDTCYPARTLAERTYVPLIECGVAKATIGTPAP